MGIIRDMQAANMRHHQRAQTELLRRMADQGAIATGPPVPPVLPGRWLVTHIVMTLLTGGLWGLVWAAHYWQAKQNRRRIYGR